MNSFLTLAYSSSSFLNNEVVVTVRGQTSAPTYIIADLALMPGRRADTDAEIEETTEGEEGE